MSRITSLTVFLAALLLPNITPNGTEATDPGKLLQTPSVKALFDAVRAEEEESIEMQAKLCSIPAPPFHEGARAAAMLEAFKNAHLEDVRIDATGNVIGVRRGRSLHPHVLIAAHLDTVFPEGTDVHVTRDGYRLKGPGIYDDCRGLTALNSMARALDKTKLQTDGTITLVADVGEEGLGDLRGMKALFKDIPPHGVDAFIAIDGPQGLDTAVTGGVGSYRFRLTYSGPGGHSFNSFGIANPIHALGRAISHIDEIEVPQNPRTTFNVGRISGGTSINTIAASASAEIDMRSESKESLDAVRGAVEQAAHVALEEENKRWGDRGKLSMQLELLGYRPTGDTALDSTLVETLVKTNEAMGLPKLTTTIQSTDANLPMSLGIPSVSLGGGGVGTGPHTLEEAIDLTDAWKGTQRILLLTLALVQTEIPK